MKTADDFYHSHVQYEWCDVSDKLKQSILEAMEAYAAVQRPSHQLAWERLTARNYPEDNEECLWCTVPICEPPYSGSRCSEDFPGDEYFTHFFRYKNEHWPDEE